MENCENTEGPQVLEHFGETTSYPAKYNVPEKAHRYDVGDGVAAAAVMVVPVFVSESTFIPRNEMYLISKAETSRPPAAISTRYLLLCTMYLCRCRYTYLPPPPMA